MTRRIVLLALALLAFPSAPLDAQQPGVPAAGTPRQAAPTSEPYVGIPNYTESPVEHARSADDMTPLEVVGLVARDTFEFAPGTRLSYTNTGYALLGPALWNRRPLSNSCDSDCPSRETT
jgi:hypothetical protein